MTTTFQTSVFLSSYIVEPLLDIQLRKRKKIFNRILSIRRNKRIQFLKNMTISDVPLQSLTSVQCLMYIC